MGYTVPFGKWMLVRHGIQTTVHLHGVAIDDLAANGARDFDSKLRLAHAGITDNSNQRLHSSEHAMAESCV